LHRESFAQFLQDGPSARTVLDVDTVAQLTQVHDIVCSMNNIRANKVRQTFTLPIEVFKRFAALVPEGKRSSIVASLLESETVRREQALARACDAANADAELRSLETDFQALEDTVSEPWETHG